MGEQRTMLNRSTAVIAALSVLVLFPAMSWAQYNQSAGQNAPTVAVEEEHQNDDGTVEMRTTYHPAEPDHYGNAEGNQYDLAVDGAFEGQTVLVLHFYTGEGFDFSLPEAALREKGFGVYRYSNGAPEPEQLAQDLINANQLWIISDSSRHLNDEHLAVILDFFESGHGIYVWGDNEPYYADANFVANALFDTTMSGNLPGDNVVTLLDGYGAGLLPNHLITTGLEHLYEGITIATLDTTGPFEPLLYGSAGNLVTAVYEHEGRRAILDGGFTRLYIHWDTAGTARYVKNAAAWLANWERFGDEVLASDLDAE